MLRGFDTRNLHSSRPLRLQRAHFKVGKDPILKRYKDALNLDG